MAYAFPNYAREVLEQVVREPRFRELTTIPTFSPVPIALILFIYTGFALSAYLFLQGQIHWSLMILVNGILAYFSFTGIHDATHRAVSGNRVFNDILGTISMFMLLPGMTARTFRYFHLEHHRYAGDKNKDPDEFLVASAPYLLPFAWAFPESRWTFWYLMRWRTRPVTERIEFALGISFYFGWHVLWLLSPYAVEFILIWMIPQRIGFLLNAYFFAHIQHPEGVLWEKYPFQCTVRIKSNALQSCLILGQSLHIVHHLLPSVPFYRYHLAWEAGKHLFEKYNIPVGGYFKRANDIVLTLPDPEPADWLETRIADWREARVVTARDVADGIREFELKPVDGDSFPSFTAGAHIDVHISDDFVRQYSLCNSPSDSDRYVIAVKKEVDGRGGSRAMHNDVMVGQTLKISDPRNHFPLDNTATDYVLVAGGIGITPILGMAYELHERSARFVVHVCARNHSSLPFADSMDTFPFSDRIEIHLSEDEQRFSPEKSVGDWKEGKKLYICGPMGFMDWVETSLRRESWPDESIFSETFVPRKIDNAENTRFEVELASSGKVLTVEPDQFLLDVLNSNGCGVICSCTQGICGSCITPVLAGEPEHRDAILTDAERLANDKMCVCVGRSKTPRLVLDL